MDQVGQIQMINLIKKDNNQVLEFKQPRLILEDMQILQVIKTLVKNMVEQVGHLEETIFQLFQMDVELAVEH